MTIEDRFIELEVKISFQEDTVQELNKVVCQQQLRIDQLEVTCKFLLNQIRDMSETEEGRGAAHEKPPHY